MGHPTLSADEVQRRNKKICAYAAANPKLSKVAIGSEFGLNRETIRLILDREEIRLRRERRMADKFKGILTAG